MSWFNNDGLLVQFGTEKATAVNGGEYSVDGGEHWVEFDLDLTTLTSSSAIINDFVILPKNVRIERVEVIVLTASAGANANLNVGLTKVDRTTAIDADGILAASDDWHTGAAGTTTLFYAGSTEVGALVGVDVGNFPSYVSAYYDTAAFTDGLIKLRLFYVKV